MGINKNLDNKDKLKLLIENPYVRITSFIIILLIAFFSWVYPFNSNNRNINIDLISSTPIIDVADNIDKVDLSFFYKGNEIKNLHYLKFRLENIGTEPIIKKDFIEDITLTLPEELSIISYSVNSEIKLNVAQIDKNKLSFNVDLLNKKEFAILELLVDYKNDILFEDINIKARIFGISSINVKNLKGEAFLSETERRDSAREKLKKIVDPLMIIMMLFLVFSITTLILRKKYYESKIFRNISKTGTYIQLITIAILIIYTLFSVARTIYYAL